MDSLPQLQGQPDHTSERRDTLMPSLQVLRGNPGISESVNILLASYEGRVHSQLTQGKQNRLKGLAAPHLHWSNEGYHVLNGKKRVLYDHPSGLLGS